MHELVKLVSHWIAYAAQHPDARADDFCRDYLAQHTVTKPAAAPPGGHKAGPADLDSRFIRAVTRTAMSAWTYMRTALKDTPLKSLEHFTLLAALHVQGESRKSAVIHYAMMEFSTGIVILNRLVAQRFVQERIDPSDKRSRLLRLTPKGEKALEQAFKKNQIVRQTLLEGVKKQDKETVVRILDPIHSEHAPRAVEERNNGK